MPYVRVPGVKGLLWEPERKRCGRKHDCTDCELCQWCTDSRCSLCRKRHAGVPPPSKADD